jgi:hypothetical protein
MRKDIEEIRRLKQEGHDIIDRLVRLHVPRNTVYLRLAAKLGLREPAAHFQNIFTARECRNAIAALEEIERERRQQIRDNRRRKQEAKAERARKEAERKTAEDAYNALPWWKKIWKKLTRKS